MPTTGKLPYGAVVLTGGRSSRMGTSKEWLTIGDISFLRRVVDAVRHVASPVVVVRSQSQKLPELPGDVIVTEDAVPDCGPLAGFVAGLTVIGKQRELVYVTSCDLPLLSPRVIDTIVSLLGDASMAVPWVGGYYHPLSAVYRVALLTRARKLLADGRRRMALLMAGTKVKVIEERELRMVDPTLLSLKPCNTPSDYAELTRAWKNL